MAQQISAFTPIIYVGILLAAFFIFVKILGRRKLNHLASLKPWYGKNIPKDLYFSLKESTADQKVPDKVLKAALLQWSAENMHRLLKMRTGKQVLTVLHQNGSVGDDVWTRFTTSEKLLLLDMNELAQESESLKTGWSQQIAQLGSEIAQNNALRRRIQNAQQATEYREAWEELKARSMKSLE